MTLITKTKLNTAIRSIAKRMGTLRDSAQEAAFNCILYRQLHGDCDFATRLVQAFGETSGAKMKRYLADFGAMRWDTNKERFKINKRGEINLTAARNMLWYQYTKETVTTELDRARARARLLKLLGDIQGLEAADIVEFSTAINEAHNVAELRHSLDPSYESGIAVAA